MRRTKIREIIFILFISIIFCIPIFSNNLFPGHDISFHLTRIQGIRDAIASRTSLKIYPYTNFGFGYGAAMFYCDIFLYFPAILYMLGIPLVISYKIFLLFLSFLGNFIAFYSFKYLLKSGIYIYIGTLMYSFSNSRIHHFFIQSGLGSCIAYCFLPLLFLAFYKIFYENDDNCWIMLGISFSLLLLSHLLTFVIACIFFFLLCILNVKTLINNKRLFFCILKAAIFAICLSAFFLFPFIEQNFSQEYWMSFTMAAEGSSLIKSSQMPLNELFSDYIFYKNINNPKDIPVTLGLIYCILPIILIILVRLKKIKIGNYVLSMMILLIFGLFVNSNIIDLSQLKFLYPLEKLI